MSKRKGLAKSCQPWKLHCPALKRKREGALERRKTNMKEYERILAAKSDIKGGESFFKDKVNKCKQEIKNLERKLAP